MGKNVSHKQNAQTSGNAMGHSESAAYASAHSLRELLMQAPAMIAVVRGPDLVFELANPLYLRAVGKTSDIIGKPVMEVFPELKGQPIEKILFDVYKTGKPFAGKEVPVQLDRDNDGTPEEYYFTFTYQPVRSTEGKIDGVMTHAVEVTELVQAHRDVEKISKKLESERARLETILNLMPTPLLLLEPNTAKVTFANKAADDLAGGTFPKGKSAEKYHTLYWCYDNEGKRIPNNQMPGVRTARGEKLSNFEMEWDTPAGRRSLLINSDALSTGDESALILNFQDITELKQAEAALKESAARMQFMAESMPQKIFTATPDGRVDYYNRQWLEFTGLGFDEIKDWGWTSFVHPDDVEDNIARWQFSVETGEPFSFENRFRRHDGVYRWHISRARALRDADDNIVMWIGSNTDIHDIKVALAREHELEERAAALAEQRSQLVALNQAKDEFISLASHQLRTPATGVKQYIGMVLEGYAGDITASQREMLEHAMESNERQINIVNDLLQVARIDAGKVTLHQESVDLVHMIEDLIEEHGLKLRKRQQTVKFNHKQPELKARVDETRMRMALDNLLDNASKYSHDGRVIIIEVSKSGAVIKIRVTDQGVGMNEGDVNRLFRKFLRLDNPLSVIAGGTGLGLYWVKKVIDLHGGSIHVDSAPGQGSTFTISLPA